MENLCGIQAVPTARWTTTIWIPWLMTLQISFLEQVLDNQDQYLYMNKKNDQHYVFNIDSQNFEKGFALAVNNSDTDGGVYKSGALKSKLMLLRVDICSDGREMPPSVRLIVTVESLSIMTECVPQLWMTLSLILWLILPRFFSTKVKRI